MDARILFVPLVMALTGGTAPGKPPAPSVPPGFQVPFEARAVQRLELFRGREPKPNDMTEVSTSMVVTVSAWVGEKSWEGRPEQVVEVKLDGRSTYSALLSRLEPLKAGVVVSSAQAGELLFTQVPKARRSWCEQFARRLSLSADGSRVLLYSGSADEECAGYLGLVANTERGPQVIARTRRGPLQSMVLHQVPRGPALLDFEEFLPGNARVTSVRRTFLGLGKPAFKELLSVDSRRDELQQAFKHSVLAEVEVEPSEQGLDIEVRQTEMRVELATGAESDHVRETRSYRYANGRLSLLQPTKAH